MKEFLWEREREKERCAYLKYGLCVSQFCISNQSIKQTPWHADSHYNILCVFHRMCADVFMHENRLLHRARVTSERYMCCYTSQQCRPMWATFGPDACVPAQSTYLSIIIQERWVRVRTSMYENCVPLGHAFKIRVLYQ